MTQTKADGPAPAGMPDVLLVGAGVVGRSIALDHVLAGVPVWLADRDPSALSASCDWVLRRSDSVAESASPWGAKIDLPVVRIRPIGSKIFDRRESHDWLLIESIAERLDVKQSFFADAENWFDHPAILTSNTSTISIEKISQSMRYPERLCGLHFFMPVVGRHAVEIIRHRATSEQIIDVCRRHARVLSKEPLIVRDAPGFVVNRMLSTYINLSMWLLCGGVSAETIERAAIEYGMPMSPLSLVDLIGPRTAFDAGRVVWQAFPHRMDPSPLLPALVKRKLGGIASGCGFYQYNEDGNRRNEGSGHPELSPIVAELIQQYRHDSFSPTSIDDSTMIPLVRDLFAATLEIESTAIVADGVADWATIDRAMRGGLDCVPRHPKSDQRAIELASRFPQIKSIQPSTG